MKKIKQKKFDELVELHEMWLDNSSKGVQLFLNNANIIDVVVKNKNLSYSIFNNSIFNNSIFDNLDFNYSTFNHSKFNYSKFNYSKFDHLDFNYSNFYYSEFHNSNFNNSKFNSSNFYNSNFYNSKFNYSEFDNSTFNHSKFDSSTFNHLIFNNSEKEDFKLNYCKGATNLFKSIHLEKYDVIFTANVIHIGCVTKYINELWNMSYEQISKLDEDALEWWDTYKESLKSIMIASGVDQSKFKTKRR